MTTAIKVQAAQAAQAAFEKALHAMNQAACDADDWLRATPCRMMPGEEVDRFAVAEWERQHKRVNAALDRLGEAEATMQPLLMEV